MLRELKRRLKERSTESDDKINMRIAKAHVELATAPQLIKLSKTTIWMLPKKRLINW